MLLKDMWLSGFNEAFPSILDGRFLLTPQKALDQYSRCHSDHDDPGPVTHLRLLMQSLEAVTFPTRALQWGGAEPESRLCYLQRVWFRFWTCTCRVRVNLVLIVTDELLLSGFTETKCWYTHWKQQTQSHHFISDHSDTITTKILKLAPLAFSLNFDTFKL